MTLQEMMNEVQSYIDDSLSDTQSKNRVISAINRAYKRICREKYKLSTEENITLDTTLTIDVKNLTKSFFRVNSITINDNELPFDMKAGNKIKLPNNQTGDIVTIDYDYIPTDLKNMTDEPELPAGIVDHKIMCYYATFEFLVIQDDEKAQYWLNLWNDGFESISSQNVNQTTVKDVYGWC